MAGSKGLDTAGLYIMFNNQYGVSSRDCIGVRLTDELELVQQATPFEAPDRNIIEIQGQSPTPRTRGTPPYSGPPFIKGTTDSSLSLSLLSTQVERFQATQVDASAEFTGLKGLSVGAMTSFAREAGFNSNSVSLVINARATTKTFVENYMDRLKLPANATELTEHGLSYFEKKYGTYIIDAVEEGAEFTAAYKFDVTSMQANREIAAMLNAVYRDVTDVTASVDMNQGIRSVAGRSSGTFSSVVTPASRVLGTVTEGLPDVTDIIEKARSFVTAVQDSQPLRCRIRRLRDFICVREALTAEPAQAWRLAGEYMKIYGLIRHMMTGLPVASPVKTTETYNKMLVFVSKFNPNQIPEQPLNKTRYNDMLDEAKSIINQLQVLGIMIDDPQEGGFPPAIMDGVDFRLINVAVPENRMYKVRAVFAVTTAGITFWRFRLTAPVDYSSADSSPTDGEERQYQGKINDWVDAGRKGYWNDQPALNYDQWELIPYGSYYLIRSRNYQKYLGPAYKDKEAHKSYDLAMEGPLPPADNTVKYYLWKTERA